MNNKLAEELFREEKVSEALRFLEAEISWLAWRVDSFPHGKLSPEENRRVNKARRGALDFAYLLDVKE